MRSPAPCQPPNPRRLALAVLALLLACSAGLLAWSVLSVAEFEEECDRSEAIVRDTAAVRVRVARARAIATRPPEPADPSPDVRPPDEALEPALTAARSESDPVTLRHWAHRAADARVRAASLERLTALTGPGARALLVEVAGDASEVEKVRGAAARLLGRTGPEAHAAIDGLLAASEPDGVRAGAAAALVELGTAESLARLDEVVRSASPRLRHAVVAGIAASTSEPSRRVATSMAADPTLDARDRAALCASLGAARQATAAPVLARAMSDAAAPLIVRHAAATALGAAGDAAAIAALESLGDDAPESLRLRAAASVQQIRRREAHAPR